MSDADEITRLLQRYGATFDARDAESFAALFADDAVVVGPDGAEIAGRERLARMVRKLPPGGGHDPGQPEIVVSGNAALATSQYRAVLASGQTVSGSYRDELCRTADGWKFARRTIVIEPA